MKDFTIGDIPRRNARQYPSKIALIFHDRKQTWQELESKTNRVANMFLDSGLKKGDRVSILDENSDRYAQLYLALSKAGIIANSINYRLSPREMATIINHAEPHTLVVGEPFFDLINTLKPELKSVKRYIAFENPLDWMNDYEETISSYPDTDPDVDVDETDVFAIMYTSGTTGLPKGVLQTNRSYMVNSLAEIMAQGCHIDDINLVVAPLYHAGGTFCFLEYAYLSCTNVILRRVDTREILNSIQKQKVTAVMLIPTMLSSLLNDPHIGEYDLSGLRHLYYGGGPMPQPVLEKAMKLLPNVSFTQGYGLTEAAQNSHLRPLDHILDSEQKQRRLKSVGRTTPLKEIKIVDDHGDALPYGQVGEIWVKGPSVNPGYWKNPKSTKENYQDGWFKTGDLGYMDEDRYLFLVDRKKDMIVSGGENIYPKEIEDVLYTHPAILEAAVIGIPDEYWGESVKAVVALKKGVTATEEELIAHCKKNLAGYKKPKSVDFMEELPKTGSGKISRRKLKDKYCRSS